MKSNIQPSFVRRFSVNTNYVINVQYMKAYTFVNHYLVNFIFFYTHSRNYPPLFVQTRRILIGKNNQRVYIFFQHQTILPYLLTPSDRRSSSPPKDDSSYSAVTIPFQKHDEHASSSSCLLVLAVGSGEEIDRISRDCFTSQR